MNEHQKTMLRAAANYYKLGFSIIPLGQEKDEVLVKWKQYQTTRATLEEIAAWIQRWPEINLGVVTGAISGIVVVDIENGGSAKGYEPTVIAKSGRDGRHLYYRHPGNRIIKNGIRVAELTDIRGDGGYVVLPPSVLSGGRSYKWIMSPDDTGFATMPALPEGTAATAKVSATTVSEMIAEGGRNDAATKEVGRILHTLMTRDWETYGWAGLREWNRTHCNPPLDETELRATYKSIASKEIVKRMDEDETNAKVVPAFNVFNLVDLYEEELPDTRWIVQDLVPLGGITAFTGESNSFKSFLTIALAGNVVNGEQFLGHFPTTQGRVLIVDEENNRRDIRKRFEELGVAPNPDILFVSQGGFRADVGASIEALRTIVEEQKPLLIILDSLIDIHTRNENDASEMNSVFLALKHKLLTDESAIIVIHHHRKPQIGQGSRPGQSMRGSSGIYAAIDAHINVHRKGSMDLIITQDKLRVQKQLDPFKVALVPTMEGPIAFAYQGEDTSKEDALLKIENTVLDLIFKASPESMTVTKLAETTGEPKNDVRAAANALVKRGLATRRNGANNTALYYLTIADRSPDDDPDEASPESDSDQPANNPD